MDLHRIDSTLSREERVKLNENFDAIKYTVSDIQTKVNDVASGEDIRSVQTQINQLVVEGDSSVEAAQARVGTDNTAYNTLKERLDNEYVAVTAQLEQKANVNYVTQQLQSANLAYKESYATLSTLQAAYPTGNQYNHVVLADGMIYTWANNSWVNTQIQANGTGIANETVTPEKTTFFKKGKNLFNKDDVTENSYVNELNGAIGVFNNYKVSNFIEVLPSTKYTRNFSHKMAFYDVNKTYISGINTNSDVMAPTTFETPSNCRYVRITVSNSFANACQLEPGEVSTPYEPYKLIIENSVLDPRIFEPPYIENEGMLADEIITPEKTTFIKKSKNLFNKDAVTTGYYVANTTGRLDAYAGFNASEFIEVKPNTEYARSYSHRMAFYNSNKDYISGLAPNADVNAATSFITPSNCRYVRLTVADNRLNTMQLEEDSATTSYAPYGSKISKELLEVVAENYVNPMTYSKFDKNKHRMLLAPKMFFVNGDTLPIYRSSFITGNEDFSVNTLRTALMYENSINEPTFNYFYEDLELNPNVLPTEFKIMMKGDRLTTKNYYNQITKVSVDRATKSGSTPKVLTFGDSLTNRATVTYLKEKLEQYGVNPTMLGTYKDTLGTRTEARGGWEFDNFVGKDNQNFGQAITLPTTTGGPNTAWLENPFLKLATTQEKTNFPNWCFRNTGSNNEKSYATDTDKTGDFYIFDINYYLTTFNVATPDVIIISLGTNDIVQETDVDSLASMKLSLEIMIKRIKLALPNVKIGIVPTVTWWIGKSNWDTEISTWIEHCITDTLTYSATYSGLEIVPVYAHINRDFIFPYGATTPISNINREVEATISDDLHFDTVGRRQYAKALGAYVMNVI